MISFSISDTDADLITKIVARAVRDLDLISNKLDLRMDLTATHANGCPLDLDRLATTDDFTFAHDIYGIVRHLDRGTGKLTRHFLPRLAKKSAA